MRQSDVSPLAQLLSQSELAPLMREVARLRRLEARWQALLGQWAPELEGQTRVVALEAGRLRVVGRHAAVLAKLRQLERRLLAGLVEGGADVNVITYRVQADWALERAEKSSAKRKIGTSGRLAIEAAVARLAASPLRDALSRLARHASPGDGE